TLKDAKAAAAIELDPHEAVALQRFQQVHQAAEAVARVVEAAVVVAKNLLHVAEIHRPACARRGGENLPRAADARLRALGGAALPSGRRRVQRRLSAAR